MDGSTTTIIAILVAGAVGLLSFTLLRFLVESRESRRDLPTEHPLTLAESLEPYFQLIPLPPFIRKRWATEKLMLRLKHAGIPWDGEDFARVHWALLWTMILLGFFLAVDRAFDLVGMFAAGLLVVGGIVAPGIWLSLQADSRQMEIDLALPDFMDRLSLGLEAGLGFEVALRRTSANFPDLLGKELRRAVRQSDRGHPVADALGELASRTTSNDMRSFVASVKQSEKLGTSLAKALRTQTDLLRARRRRRAQEASRRLPILIVFPLVFCFLPALMVVYLAPPLLNLLLGQ